MGIRGAWPILFVGLLCGCLGRGDTPCGDGRTCPEGTSCDLEHDRCLTADQARACLDLAEGDLCEANGRDMRCVFGACVPACGDGVLDADEECDDRDFINHDGCSSVCRTETLAWEPWRRPWQPRTGHAAAVDTGRGVLVVFGGEDDRVLDDTWERDATGNWTQLRLDPHPPARTGAAMAYDANTGAIVLFGGEDAAKKQFDDTWEYVAGSWRQVAVAGPPARALHGMAFDASRDEVILVGGRDQVAILSDTWSYAAGAWTKIAGVIPPNGSLASPAVAFSTTRNKIVLFGGKDGAGESARTLELSGNAWSIIATGGPAARSGAGLAELAGTLVLFGGNGSGSKLSDTWELTGSSWTRRDLDAQPAPTTDHTLSVVPDPQGAGTLVLVGGTTELGATAEIVELTESASRWTRVATVGSPVTRIRPCAVATADDGSTTLATLDDAGALWRFEGDRWTRELGPDAELTSFFAALGAHDARHELVRFGGFVQPQTFSAETFVSVGGNFAPFGGLSPPGRARASMAYDPARQVLVMYGGSNNQTVPTFDDTWEWDGGWRAGPAGPAETPGLQSNAPMAFDPGRGMIVLLADDGSTWTYDGAWTRLDLPPTSPRIGGAMAYFPSRDRLVVFGGGAGERYADVIELTDAGWVTLPVAGTPPSARTLACLGLVTSARALVMHGGSSTTNEIDTWELRLGSTLPDEDCRDGTDNDSDGRVDVQDPDCP